jgi:hypothetical protein
MNGWRIELSETAKRGENISVRDLNLAGNRLDRLVRWGRVWIHDDGEDAARYAIIELRGHGQDFTGLAVAKPDVGSVESKSRMAPDAVSDSDRGATPP